MPKTRIRSANGRMKPVETAAKPEPTAIEIIQNARRRIEWFFEYTLDRCLEVKKEFLASAAKVDPADLDLSYLVKRSTENIFIEGTKERELLGMISFYKKNIDARDGGVEEVLDIFIKTQNSEINRLIESPYRHNSTCAVSNFHQECEFRAKAEFWKISGLGRGTAKEVICVLKEWLAAETEVLEYFKNKR